MSEVLTTRALRSDLRDSLPASMARLPTDSMGRPVPWFVDRSVKRGNGDPDFRIMDGAHLKVAIRERRCWVCGGKLRDPQATFVIGPMCGVNRTASEPPAHHDCARWSVRACPFLSQPKRLRDERDLPPGKMAGVGILRNPGVTLLWTSSTYTTWRPETGGVLFDIGEPITVECWREGRAASRTEVTESVETGLPLLLAQAARDGAVAIFELGRMTERFLTILPREEPQP